MISEVRLIGSLFSECLVTNQPQNVLTECSYISILVIRYSSTGEKSITVETSVQYSVQKYDHLTADRVMTTNIKSFVFAAERAERA